MNTTIPLVHDIGPLRIAWGIYIGTQPQRDALWESAEGVRGVEEAVAADNNALIALQAAYYEVTKDRNTREDCTLVSPDDVQRLLIRYGEDHG